MMTYYDMQGRPMTQQEWWWAFEDSEDRTIGRDMVGDVRISTVWLGLNHNWSDGPPLIFETMIFGGAHDDLQWRYPTRELAELGHERAVELVRQER